MPALAIAFGCLVGFALGLTGGGGGILAVPLLVYGLGVSPQEAVGISLAAVGGTSLSGAIPRLLRGEVDLKSGLLFAVAGSLGTPIGSGLASHFPDRLLMILFAALMLFVATRMWRKTRGSQTENSAEADENKQASQRSAPSVWRHISLLLMGLLTGVLSGLFGVGGGFVIVPALVLFCGMPMHRAVSTSLFVIVLISISGVIAHLLGGNRISLPTTALFVTGGFVGMSIGGTFSKRLSGVTLQRVFAGTIILVAGFVIFKSMTSLS